MGAIVEYTQKAPSGLLYYRRAFPADLQPFVPGTPKQLRKSLGSSSITAPGALERYQQAAVEYGRLTSIARKAKSGAFDALDDQTIAYLIEVFQRDTHEGAKRQVEQGKAEEGRYAWDWMMTDEYRQWRVDQDVDEAKAFWGRWARGLLDIEGLIVAPEDRSFGRLCMALNDAAIGMSREILAMLHGEVIPIPTEPVRPKLRDVSAQSAKAVLSFPDIVEKIHASPIHKLSETTKETGCTALRYFREAFGDLAPKDIDRLVVTDWLALLAGKPTSPARADRKLKLRDLVKQYEDEDVRRLSPKTLEQYVAALSARWRQATSDGLIAANLANPFSGRKIPQSRRPERKVQFSLAELQSIFNLPIFTEGDRPKGGKGDASYWMPLLLLWTGARPEEIAQLLVSDIQQDPGGGWLLRITDEDLHPHKGRRLLKTTRSGSGRRTFPLPQSILKLGFIDYVKHLHAAGKEALFPALRPKGRRNYLHSQWATWWGGHLRSVGVLPPPSALQARKPAREFRDVWATAARTSGLTREAMEYIMGHSPPRPTSNERYGDRDPLGDQISRLRFDGLELSAVRPWSSK